MFKIGDRVKTLIHLDSADWDPEQGDIPAGALGTVTSVHHDQVTGFPWSYGVLLDADVHQLPCDMRPAEIGHWHGHDGPNPCAYVGGISSNCTCNPQEQP